MCAWTTDSRVFDQLVESDPDKTRILAEGDSWFAYPKRFFLFGKASNIVDHLGKKNNLIIYSTSSSGDEAAEMLSNGQKFSLLKRLKHNDFHLLLFSGGGNDLVGKYDFGYLLKRKTPSMSWDQCIHKKRLNNKIKQIETVYEELIGRVKDCSANPDIKIVTHTYDYAIPIKKGYQLFDVFPMGESWMWPYLMDKGIDDPQDQRNIAKEILVRFRNKLLAIENRYPGEFKVVNTQGTIADNEWRNEIHPRPGGFKKIANKVYSEGIEPLIVP